MEDFIIIITNICALAIAAFVVWLIWAEIIKDFQEPDSDDD